VAKPHYYKVYLADYDVTAEVTPTERAAMFRFSFGKTDSAFVVLDAFDRGSEVQIIPEKNMIIGYSSRYSRGKLPNFKNYFVVVFDRPFTNQAVWEGKMKKNGVLKIQADHVGAIVGFKSAGKQDVIHARVASSFISAEQAQLNLKELGNNSFDADASNARKQWNDKLGKIKVEGGTIDQRRTF